MSSPSASNHGDSPNAATTAAAIISPHMHAAPSGTAPRPGAVAITHAGSSATATTRPTGSSRATAHRASTGRARRHPAPAPRGGGAAAPRRTAAQAPRRAAPAPVHGPPPAHHALQRLPRPHFRELRRTDRIRMVQVPIPMRPQDFARHQAIVAAITAEKTSHFKARDLVWFLMTGPKTKIEVAAHLGVANERVKSMADPVKSLTDKGLLTFDLVTQLYRLSLAFWLGD